MFAHFKISRLSQEAQLSGNPLFLGVLFNEFE
jgi:hypothetical protein